MIRRESRMDRRQFLVGAGTAGTAALAGCAGILGSAHSANQNAITLTYWTLFAGGDGEAMTQMVRRFNSEHTRIQIDKQRIPWDQYYKKMFMALAGGSAPDIAIVHASRMRRFGPVMEPVSDSINFDKYTDITVEKSTIRNALRGMPLDLHPVATYYNKDVFEQAGLDPERSIMGSWAEFKSACNQIVDRTDATAYDQGTGVHSLRVVQPWLRELGSGLLKKNDDTWRMGFHNSDGMSVATIIDKMVAEWQWQKKSGDIAWEAFVNSNHAMLNEGTWAYGRYKDADFEWGVMRSPPMPGTSKNLTWADSHVLTVPQDNERSKKKTQAAKKATKWLTQEASVTWGKNAGHLPAFIPARSAKELHKAPVWDKTLSLFTEIVTDDDVVYMPQTTKNSEYISKIYQNTNAVRTQNMTPETALDTIQTQLRRVFE